MDKYLFLSCNMSKEDVELIKDKASVNSIYRVSGIHPWLIICNFSNIEDFNIINELKLHQFKLKYMSVGIKEIKTPEVFFDIPSEIDYLIVWVFISHSAKIYKEDQRQQHQDSIVKYSAESGLIIDDFYKIFGEYDYIVKFKVKDMDTLDHFSKFCKENEFVTLTKFVLDIKIEDHSPCYKQINLRKRVGNIKRGFDYTTTRILFNNKTFFNKHEVEQYKYLEDNLKANRAFIDEDKLLEITKFGTTNNEFFENTLNHPIKYIRKYSIDLKREGWIINLLFFKSKPNRKEQLEKQLFNKLLGVAPEYFAKDLYHITGEYDFFIIFYCKDIYSLDNKIKSIISDIKEEYKEEVIEAFQNIICFPPYGDGRPRAGLSTIDTTIIESLLINSTNIKAFEQKLLSSVESKTYETFLKGDVILSEENITPREDFIRLKLEEEYRNVLLPDEKDGKSNYKDKLKDDLINYFRKFRSFNDIGLEPKVELFFNNFYQFFVEIIFNNVAEKDIFKLSVDKNISQNELMAIKFEPIANPLSIYYIFIYKEYIELRNFLLENERLYNDYRVQIIFHQRTYSKILEDRIRCRPCFYPLKTFIECDKNCFGCKQLSKCWERKCGTCIKYISERSKSNIMIIDKGKAFKEEIILSIITFNINAGHLLSLSKYFDNSPELEKFYDYYKKQRGTNRFELLKETYEKIINKQDFREKYKNNIINILDKYTDNYNIILFPEYSIPKYVFNDIIKADFNKKCLIIAGSHLDDGFNVSPIIFNKSDSTKEIYFSIKNKLNPFENGLKTNFNLIKYEGAGNLKFKKTIWGNFFLKICYDVFSVGLEQQYNDIDILLIPSYNTHHIFKDKLVFDARKLCICTLYGNIELNKIDVDSEIIFPQDDPVGWNIKTLHDDQCQEQHIYPTPEFIDTVKNEMDHIDPKLTYTIYRCKFNLCWLDNLRRFKSKSIPS